MRAGGPRPSQSTKCWHFDGDGGQCAFVGVFRKRQRVLGDEESNEPSEGGRYEMIIKQLAEPANMSRRRILAVASAGGHWVQLQRLRPAFEGHDVAYVTTNGGYRGEVFPHRFYAVNDASRWNKLRLAQMAVRILVIVLRERPDVVVTTGAACGYFAIRFGKFFSARTLWIDSIANIDEMSMSARLARRYTDLWLTQWPHLASPDGPHYAGAVL